MKKRPTSITVIAWILIITGGLSLIGTTFSLNNPEVIKIMEKSPVPIFIQNIIMYVGLIITITSGIAILKGLNWGRYTYVIWSIFSFIFSLLTSPMKMAMIPGLVILLIVIFFLFRSPANNYFVEGERE
ncbi:hypothetical protein [Orenia marismortui]|uniref:hypothetical protein n=1 Tax=Orenia marismortui TaxID=46469 RepID=UPI000371FB68|nr:hypothetical protein [Orenia marismortui]